jgi:hypothetical protein
MVEYFMSKIKGNWFITPHAIDRYLHKYPKLTRKKAFLELIRISEMARLVKEHHPGIFIYRTGKPKRHRLVVSTRMPGLPQLVTVLN